MKQQIGRGLIVLFLLWACAAGCRKKQQAKFDLSTPRAAALTFLRCLEHDDAAGAKAAAVYGGMEGDQIDAMASLSSGMHNLRAAAEEKFGPGAMHTIEPNAVVDVSETLDPNDVRSDQTHATVASKDLKAPIPLKLVDGVWKVDIGALSHGRDMTQTMPYIGKIGRLADHVAGDIKSGKLKSIDDARDAIRRGTSRIFAGQSTEPSATAPSP